MEQQERFANGSGKEQPLVSVIVPVYNVEEYLGQCIESILNQTYPHIEVLLIDDGSTDRSEEICQEYAQKDKRIRLYCKENGGASAARNFGIERVMGEFLTFVDSDDWIEENAIEELVTAQKKYNVKAVIASHNQFDESEGVFYFRSLDSWPDERVFNNKEFMEELPSLEYADVTFHMTCMKLWSKSLFEHFKLSDRGYAEDLAMNYKLYLQCRQIVFLNKSLYWYRIHSDSISRTLDIKTIFFDDLYFRMERMALLATKGYDIERYRVQMINRIKEHWFPMLEQSNDDTRGIKKQLEEILLVLEKQV